MADRQTEMRFVTAKILYHMWRGKHMDMEWFTVPKLLKHLEDKSRLDIEEVLVRFLKLNVIEGRPAYLPCEFRIKGEELTGIHPRVDFDHS